MTDIVDRLRAHSNAFNAMSNAEWMGIADAFLEDAAAEIERLRAGGCARDQGTTQYCAEAAKLAAESERLRAALRGANRYLPYWRPRTELARQIKLETLAMIRAALEGHNG